MNHEMMNAQDMQDHRTVSAALVVGEKALVFWHLKLEMWAIPGGKVEPGQTILDALRTELRDEVGVVIHEHQVTWLATGQFRYNLGGVWVNAKHYVAILNEWEGTPTNKEPHKHSELRWMGAAELQREPQVTDATKLWIKWRKQVVARPQGGFLWM